MERFKSTVSGNCTTVFRITIHSEKPACYREIGLINYNNSSSEFFSLVSVHTIFQPATTMPKRLSLALHSVIIFRIFLRLEAMKHLTDLKVRSDKSLKMMWPRWYRRRETRLLLSDIRRKLQSLLQWTTSPLAWKWFDTGGSISLLPRKWNRTAVMLVTQYTLRTIPDRLQNAVFFLQTTLRWP